VLTHWVSMNILANRTKSVGLISELHNISSLKTPFKRFDHYLEKKQKKTLCFGSFCPLVNILHPPINIV
jgi:hypothetical protein